MLAADISISFMTYISEVKFIFMKSKRRYTVCRKPGYLDNTTPEMRIAGKWMSSIGFHVGDHVDLILEENQIIIRPAVDEIPNMVEEAPGTVIPD